MSEHGFKLDQLPGNMVVVLAKISKEDLTASAICPSDYSINNQQEDWLVISPTQSYDPEFLANLAGEISARLNCPTIKYSFYDGTGHHQFVLYHAGEIAVSYSYGDFDEEMAEYMGERKVQPNETVVTEGGLECIYYSTQAHPDKSEIASGEKFFNRLFEDQNVCLSWDYLPS